MEPDDKEVQKIIDKFQTDNAYRESKGINNCNNCGWRRNSKDFYQVGQSSLVVNRSVDTIYCASLAARIALKLGMEYMRALTLATVSKYKICKEH